MAATIIDGKAIAAKVREDIRKRADRLRKKGIIPCLAMVLVGEDPASVSYVKGKQKALMATSMESRDLHLSSKAKEEELLSLINSLGADEKVHGILIQLPLPPHIREGHIISAVDPLKDVDCFNPYSFGKLLQGQGGFMPCTPQGIIVLLKTLKIPTAGKHVVVVGRSNIVGKPLAMLLAQKEQNATVTICHTGTTDLASFTRQADILVAAAGSPGLIRGDMIKVGAAVIDVGVSRNQDGHLLGDVNFEEALEVASFITPVPGGVGPMTIAMLMQNVVQAAEEKENKEGKSGFFKWIAGS